MRSNLLILALEPYICVEIPRYPRDLNETRLGFIHGKEDGIEGIGTGRLDLEAVLFVWSPVLQAKRGGGLVRYRQLSLGIMHNVQTHLPLMLFVAIRNSFAARTLCRSGCATHGAALGGHREGFKVKVELLKSLSAGTICGRR